MLEIETEPDLLEALRTGTRSKHAQLDAGVGSVLASSREAYVRFLSASLRAAAPLEGAIANALGDSFAPLRGAAILEDLAELCVVPPTDVVARRAMDEASAFGAAYVIEGSALGGVVLAREVARALGSEIPTRYLQLRGAETSARWKWFLTQLQAFGARSPRAAHEKAVTAACAAFDVYIDALVEDG